MAAISPNLAPVIQYDKLDRNTREIRLLLLQPSLEDDVSVACSLKTVSLLTNPEYEAISYVWGDQTVTRPIVLQGQTVAVATSIWSALKALRHNSRLRTLWIDVVCINQADLAEREAQVQLMGTIYRQAVIVRVWLGTETAEDRDAISILKTLAARDGMKDVLGLGDGARAKTEQLKRFFERPWWQRLWVVQEVGNGRQVTFQVGEEMLDYDDLYQAYEAADEHFKTTLRGYNYGSFASGIDNFMAIFDSVSLLQRIRRLCQSDNPHGSDRSVIRQMTMNWMAIANLLRSRKATVASDKLYALYGLLPAASVGAPGMEPSYSLTTEAAFTRATFALMESTKTLMMFNYLAPRGELSKDLPSWVPDWRLASTTHHELTMRSEREHIFRAAKDTDFVVHQLSGNAICLKGFFIDLVKQWQSTPIVPNASPMLEGCYNSWREMWANTHPDNAMLKPYLDGSDGETAFRRTMVWDCQLGGKSGNGISGGDTLQNLTQEEGLAMFEAHDLAVKIAFAEDLDVMGQNLSEQDARRTSYMINCARSRAFFVTASGCIGMTEHNIEAGDHIFVVAGNSHPVVLRPSKQYADTWHAVSECYLHAFMYGSGVDNIAICQEFEQFICSNPAILALKGTEKNPKLDELDRLKPELEPFWKWLLVE